MKSPLPYSDGGPNIIMNNSSSKASSFLVDQPHSTLNPKNPKQIKFNNEQTTPTKSIANQGKMFTYEIEKELSDLQLTIEKEMEQTSEYYGHCGKCNKPVYGRANACQAMNSIFHLNCFTCVSCGRQLRGKPFYFLNNTNQIYCEEDYLYSGYLENAQKCSQCNHLIVDKILQALGKSYHPNCFRCYSCNCGLDGLPFTLDINNRVYCINDYFK
jgi:hypothetical protein